MGKTIKITESDLRHAITQAITEMQVNEFCDCLHTSMNEVLGSMPHILDEMKIYPVVNESNIDNKLFEQTLKEACEVYLESVAATVKESQLNEIAHMVVGGLARVLGPHLVKMAMPLITKYGLKFFTSRLGKIILRKLGNVTAEKATQMFTGNNKQQQQPADNQGGSSIMRGIGSMMLGGIASNMLGNVVGGMFGGRQ